MLLDLELLLVGGIMIVNFCGNRYTKIFGNWAVMYNYVMRAFHELGYDVRVSPVLEFQSLPEFVTRKIVDNEQDIYIYNHTHLQDIKNKNFRTGSKTLFLKPTGPTHDHFTIDTIGYAASSSITYERPNFQDIDSYPFFNSTALYIKQNRGNKWKDRADLQFFEKDLDVPEDHILIIGQLPQDETVTHMSFGSHWDKLCSIVESLKHENIVIKLHPTLESESKKIGTWDKYAKQIQTWLMEGLCVFYDFESLYDILPKTRVAIVENSTAGIDCLLHEVPVISYGYPEYHWVTKDLRHLNLLKTFVYDLSWWNKELANKWVAWYCTEYQCYNYVSTLKRVKELTNDC